MSNYNDIDSGQINEIKKGLQSIGEAIETVANRVVPDKEVTDKSICLLYTSPSPRDLSTSRMPSSA